MSNSMGHGHCERQLLYDVRSNVVATYVYAVVGEKCTQWNAVSLIHVALQMLTCQLDRS